MLSRRLRRPPVGASSLPNLLVVGPPSDAASLIKLFAGGPDRLHDYDDLVFVWPHCSFASAPAAHPYSLRRIPTRPPTYIEDFVAEAIAAA